MKNIFKNAYFGKPYKTRDNKKVLYHGSEKHKSGDGKVWTYHYLMMEPETININGEDTVTNHYDAYVNDNGIGRFASLKYYKDSGASAEYDIISEWQEETSEEEFNEILPSRNKIQDYLEEEGFLDENGCFIDTIERAVQIGYELGYKRIKLNSYE